MHIIKQITISNFKSIESATIGLKRLNLLVGANSAGKSTATQALMLAYDNNEVGEKERLCQMLHLRPSTFNEMRNYVQNAKRFDIQLDEMKLAFTPADDELKKTSVRNVSGQSIETKSLLYLPATRMADLGHPAINTFSEQNPLGFNGEFIIDYYYNHRQDILPEQLIESKLLTTLEGQVSYWLEKLTSYKVQVRENGSEYEVLFTDSRGKELKPNHVGTGISFILELLVVCLSAKDGDLIIVENPEIHLHPKAQALVMDFFARITSNSSFQVVVETHSDHLFNGIRRLLHENKMKLDDVSVHNFVIGDDGLTIVKEVQLSQQGGIMEYIPGMFDQFDDDLDAILK